MSDHLILEVTAVLPDLHCPYCGVGLEVWSDDDDVWGFYGSKNAVCPKCDHLMKVDKSVTTTYTAEKGE